MTADGGADPELRVAITVPSLRGGGLERMATDLALSLRAYDIVPALFAVAGLGIYERTLQEGEVAVYDAQQRGPRIRGLPTLLLRQIGRFRPDVIHAHSGTWYPAAVAKLWFRIPLVFTDHGRYPPESRGRAFVERQLSRVTNAIVAVTPPLATYIQDFLRLSTRPVVVPNGIDLNLYRPAVDARVRLREEWGVPPESILLICVGRFVSVKNHAGLIDALVAGGPGIASTHLVLLGTGPLEADTRARVEALGLSARVHFAGFRRDMADCLSAADVWVSASSTEALPVALIEALASGVPVLATDVGGVADTLGTPPAGVLVPPGDVRAFADGIGMLAANPELRTRLAERARARARSFSLASMTAAYVSLYRDIVAGRDVTRSRMGT